MPGMPPSPEVTTSPNGKRPTRKPAARKVAAPKRPGGDAARKAAARRNKAADYRKGVTGLLQMAGLPLLAAGKATHSTALLADAVAISTHAEPVAEAVADLAVEDARVAAVLDKLMSVGPYSALIGAVMPLAIQLAANHGIIGPDQAAMLGATPPAEYVAELAAQAEAAEAERERVEAEVDAELAADRARQRAARGDAVTPPPIPDYVGGSGDPTEPFLGA